MTDGDRPSTAEDQISLYDESWIITDEDPLVILPESVNRKQLANGVPPWRGVLGLVIAGSLSKNEQPTPQVPDLMEALRASIEATRHRKGG